MSDQPLMLDAGSGHHPHPDADVLADAYLENQERSDDAIIDRPFVLADIEHLPFKDDAFEFVHASQVVEHTENPRKAVSELERVGEAGQIDTPSFINENVLFGREFHDYCMLSFDDEAHFVPSTRDGSRLQDWWNRDGLFKKTLQLLDRVVPVRISRYHWGGEEDRYYEMKIANANTKLGALVFTIDKHIEQRCKELFDKALHGLLNRGESEPEAAKSDHTPIDFPADHSG